MSTKAAMNKVQIHTAYPNIYHRYHNHDRGLIILLLPKSTYSIL